MSPRRVREVLFLTSLLVPLAFNQVLANPVDGNVAAGTASIAGEGTANLEVHQTSDKAIIDWRSFDIAPGETTRFIQPGIDSVTLNRIIGGLGASTIDGTLTANGKVFLINPDGIAFGMGALIDTSGLVASTIDIANDAFMAGNYAFSRPGRGDASVVNLGTITATNSGFAALVAPGVRNAGVIAADLGQIALASGNSFTLDLYGDQLITLTVGDEIAGEVKDAATGETLDALVKNEGTIRANGGTVYMSAATARKVVDSVINNTGVVEANSVGRRNGKIVLGAGTASTKTAGAPSQKVKVSGTVSASGKAPGETGGAVQVTGEEIELAAATIDASGSAGGGTVLIGGDVGGGNPNPNLLEHEKAKAENAQVATATNTSVDSNSSINASATAEGDGGKVVVWAVGATDFAGSITATGGMLSGDGGFAEVSGLHSLGFNGHTDLSAWSGYVGTLLLDPLNVVIGGTGSSSLSIAALQSALASGNVIVTTGNTGAEAGDITVASSLTWENASDLTLSAYRDITINDGITIANTGAGDLNLRADETGIGVGTVSFLGTGHINYAASTGLVSTFYNPADYAAPTDYAPFALMNNSVSDQLTAYMLVNDVLDLQNISQNLKGKFALGRDIDASETATWNGGAGFDPIGTKVLLLPGDFDSNFDGILLGQGHTVSGLHINHSVVTAPWLDAGTGVFAALGASGRVANLTLVNLTMSRTIQVGIVEPYIGGLVGFNSGTIENVSVFGTVASQSNAEFAHAMVGGVAGMNAGLIVNSRFNGNVEGPGVLGGLAAGNSGTISRSSAGGTISGNQGNTAGGLVGFNTNGGLISQSESSGIITATDWACLPFCSGGAVPIGGLVGHNGGTVTRSNATGAVTLVGLTSGVGADVGGLVGHNAADGTITDSFATTGVSTDADYATVGGFVGTNFGLIERSSSHGAVENTGSLVWLGGFVGDHYGTIVDSYTTASVTVAAEGGAAGGFAGGHSGEIDRSYSASFVDVAFSGGPFAYVGYLGGFAGYMSSGNNVYWDVDKSGLSFGGVPDSSLPIGLTTFTLKSALPTGYDPGVWGLDSSINGGYPHLLWQAATPPTPPPTPTLTVFSPPFGSTLPPIEPPPPVDTSSVPADVSGRRQVDGLSDTFNTGLAGVNSEGLTAFQPWAGSLEDILAAIQMALPYALMAADSYNTTENSVAGFGLHRSLDSTQLFALHQPVNWALASSIGFYAASFIDFENKNIVLAFRGSQGLGDWITNAGERFGLDGTQYALAVSLTSLVERLYPDYAITLTGHSLGGAIASYVGGKKGLPSVVFNAARNASSAQNTGGAQLNVITTSDAVGDIAALLSDDQKAVWKTFAAGSTYLNGPVLRLPGTGHSIGGIISSLRDAPNYP